VGSFFVVVFGVGGLDLVTFNCFLLFFVVVVWCLGFWFLDCFVGVWLNMTVF